MFSKLKHFVLPEEDASLKLVFDNVRNYAICGGTLLFSVWLFGQSAKAVSPGMAEFAVGRFTIRLTGQEIYASAIVSAVVTVFLLGLNTIQTWLLLLHPAMARLHLWGTTPQKAPSSVPGRFVRFLIVTAVFAAFSAVATNVALLMLSLATVFVTK
jgi:hypothetical protein